MSSVAVIKFEPNTVGVSPEQWAKFCETFKIEHSPNTIGRRTFYSERNDIGSRVEIDVSSPTWREDGIPPGALHEIRFSTFFMADAIPKVAELSMLAWLKWGGNYYASPEVRAHMAGLLPPRPEDPAEAAEMDLDVQCGYAARAVDGAAQSLSGAITAAQKLGLRINLEERHDGMVRRIIPKFFFPYTPPPLPG